MSAELLATRTACIDCGSTRLDGPDREGFRDCLDCGAAFIPGVATPEPEPATRPEPPPPWLCTMDPWAVRARMGILIGSNAALLAVAWLLNPPH